MQEEKNLFYLDDELLNKYKNWQEKNQFSRTLDGDSESEIYLPGSSASGSTMNLPNTVCTGILPLR